ncbi:MAG: HEPN domain-containing protein [Chloroflexi bacterium]|nr:HEPN domain-containing protein [Chloroflexota bacterium]
MNHQHEQEIHASLERANASIQAAKTLLANAYPDFAASRAYYAAFYAATALLLSEGLKYRRHSGVIAAIHREFVKTGELSQEQGKHLNWLFELRNVGDYGMTLHVTSETAESAIAAAQDFLDAVQTLLESRH